LNLDDEIALITQLEDDEEGNSWNAACGIASQTTLYNAPDFVNYNKNDKRIVLKPIELNHIGLFIIGV